MINGIDISNWQGNVDFSKVREQNYEVVFIKATEGLHTLNTSLDVNYNSGKENGFKIGFYHFLHGNEDGKAQAQFMYDTIKNKSYDCKIAIDVEVSDNANADTLSQIVCDFADTIKALTGNDVVLYTYSGFLGSNLNSVIDKYPLWIAEYGVSKPSVSNYIAWQYSQTGKVDGVNSAVDLDYFTQDILLTKNNISNLGTPILNEINFKVGDKVKIIGNTYATGQSIPSWVKNNVYTIEQITDGKALLQQILSWVYIKDLEILSNEVYTVVNGDTLGAIATKFNTTVSNLCEINNISNPNLIYVGQKIRIN